MANFWIVLAASALLTGTAAAQLTEHEIVNEFLAQFDGSFDPGTGRQSVVLDDCQRSGGTYLERDVPRLPNAAANNNLMMQHVEWHAERGKFMGPTYTQADSDPYGREFLEFHQQLIRTYADWREINNYSALIEWAPSDPIPSEFAYEVEAPCLARASEDPNIALPTYLTVGGGTDESPYWGYTDLCSIPDNNRLGKIIEESGYHDDTHEGVGGDMMVVEFTLRDPIFWAWHNHIEGIHQEWYACFDVAAVMEGEAEANGFGVMLTLSLLLVAWLRRQ